MTHGWALVLVMVGSAGALLAALSMVRRDREAFGPELRRMCRALHIPAAERRALARVARRAGLRSAASMLISQGAFAHAMTVARPGPRVLRRLERLRSGVFGVHATE